METIHEQISLPPLQLDASIRESYKILRTNLLYKKGIHVIAITSALANEGKSITAYHLAHSFAKAGKKVLLVDGDMRRSQLCQYIQESQTYPGCSDWLKGTCQRPIYATTVPNLSLLFAGAKPANPSELLSQESFPMLLQQLKEIFDYVLIDTPPICCATDATIIGRYADGVLLVVRSNFVKRKVLEKTKKIIQRNHGKLIGVLLNRVEQCHGSYYGYEDYE